MPVLSSTSMALKSVAIAATAALASGACSASTDDNMTAGWNAGPHAMVAYGHGPCEHRKILYTTLNDGDLKTLEGTHDAMEFRQETLTPAELARGRQLFTSELIARYRQASIPEPPVEDPPPPPMTPPIIEDPDDPNSSDWGGDWDFDGGPIRPNPGPDRCVVEEDIIALTVYTSSSSLSRVMMGFPIEGSDDPATAEMLEYLSTLFETYRPASP